MKNLWQLEGIVTECLSNAQFYVQVNKKDNPVIIRCYLNGKMRQNKIKILVGDKVKLEMPPTENLENGIGRITYRLK